MDPGRVLQHQGRHPERDDRSAQVPGRGTHCNNRPSHNPITELSKKCVCHIWTDSNCRKWNKERDGRGETRGWSERSSSSEAGDRNGHLCDTECSQLLQALEEGGGQVETVSWCIRGVQTLSNHRFSWSRPPLRGFLMDGDFYVAASLATTLTKVALRYVDIVQEKRRQNVSNHWPGWK